jgi:hypothetical protein
LPGFLLAAAETGLPLRIREIGASAGLNLRFDRYRYALGPHRWGDAASPVEIAAEWRGGRPPLEAPLAVASRAGCDLEPRRADDPDEARRLESYVWPDQPERLRPLRAALRLARESPLRVERASAGEWLARELAEPAEGECTVVFHSAVWIYLAAAEQERVRALVEERGARATARAPCAWLRHEDGALPATIELRLRLWPGGEERLLALGHPHGRRVEWLLS